MAMAAAALIIFGGTFFLVAKGLPIVKVGVAEEVQNAICKITTKELAATANATISRQLKNVCTSDEFQARMERLEKNLSQQIGELKKILDSLVEDQGQYKSLSESIENDLTSDNSNTRMEEISIYNDTVVEANEENIYMYYWRVENINDVLAQFDLYKSSPNFYVLGHSLQLRFYPNYPEKDFFALQLKPLSKGFIKKHRILILSQRNSNADLNSGVLHGVKSDETMFQLSSDLVKSDEYIKNNAVICALKIYLDS